MDGQTPAPASCPWQASGERGGYRGTHACRGKQGDCQESRADGRLGEPCCTGIAEAQREWEERRGKNNEGPAGAQRQGSILDRGLVQRADEGRSKEIKRMHRTRGRL